MSTHAITSWRPRGRPVAPPARRAWVAAAVVALFAASAAPAAAQVQRIEQARVLFEEGVAAADAGSWELAEGLFRRARALHASPALSFNHAAVLAHLDRVLEASVLLRLVVADTTALRSVRADAGALLREVEPRIGRLAIIVRGSVDASVAVDGVEVATSTMGVPQPIDPGSHVVTSTRLGIEIARTEVLVHDGEVVWANLDVPRVLTPEDPVEATMPPAVPPAALAVSDGPPPENLAENGWLWLGVGLGALAVAAAIAIPIGVATSAPASPPPTCGSLGCWEIGR